MVLSAGPVALAGTVTTLPAAVFTVFLTPFKVTLPPSSVRTMAPAGANTVRVALRVSDCPAPTLPVNDVAEAGAWDEVPVNRATTVPDIGRH